MPPKILRDISAKASFTISLTDKEIVSHVKNIPGLIDLSKPENYTSVSGRNGRQLNDIIPVKKGKNLNGSREANGELFFHYIDRPKKRGLDKVHETMRLASAGVLILFILNIINVYQRGMEVGHNVIASASSGYEDLMKGGKQAQNADFLSAEQNFTDAEKSFADAKGSIAFLQTHSDSFFAKEKTITSVQNLLSAAKNIASAGQDFSRGVQSLEKLPELFILANTHLKDDQKEAKVAPSLTEKLKEDLSYIQKAKAKIDQAGLELSRVSAEVIPVNLRSKLTDAQGKVEKLRSVLNEAESKIPAVLDLLGDRYPHSYLVLLQNDTESRPTGGFIGSVMLIDVNDGYITKFDFKDVYDFDGQLKEEIAAPEDIASITKYWRLRDSNYSPDFPLSAEKAAWFLQKEKGPSVDTVIALNQSFVGRLLEITGPVGVEGLQSALDKSNYQLVLSYIVESKLNGENSPKIVVNKFIKAFQKKLFTSNDNWKRVLAEFIRGINEKSILMYSRHREVQDLFDEFGLSGRVIQEPSNDYLNVTVTSIGGNKSDLYIKQNIEHNTIINPNGDVIDEVTVVRRHTWNQEIMNDWQKELKKFGFNEISETVKNILGRGTNKAMMKVYAPAGSVLLDVEPLNSLVVETKYDKEIQKTYFMFPMNVDPGIEKKVTIRYQLPQKLKMYPVDTYRINIQRQPGLVISNLVKQVIFKPGFKSYAQYPKDTFKTYDSGNVYYEGKLETDLYLSAVVGQ
ncbi:DUF4012 domain-containing protein [Candidatus Peregrinibacteria bacterium]|nr:DUF4012 domain-containing protein [Candidatus Peregrinibacteria bacterium]